jgi:hypothetical protein
MDEDDDQQGFLDVEGMGIVSVGAFQLHTAALIHSFDYETPGFVPDDYLEAITAETTVTVLELETAGLWERREGGYIVKDDAAVRLILNQRERADRLARECQARGHHLPDEEGDADWQHCTHCMAPLKRSDGKPVAGDDGSPPDYTGWR